MGSEAGTKGRKGKGIQRQEEGKEGGKKLEERRKEESRDKRHLLFLPRNTNLYLGKRA